MGRRFRDDRIRPGTSWDHVEALWSFDRSLRLLCLDAAEIIEVGVRTRLAYVLGRRDRMGHIHLESLDGKKCAKNVHGRTAFERWLKTYGDLKFNARNEDFVRHHVETYGDNGLPVWVAVEFFQFGAMNRLFSMMRDDDQTEVARRLGVTSGKKLHSLLLGTSYVRYVSAHHSRLWNRRLTTKLPKLYPTEVSEDLLHLTGQPMGDKLYSTLAVMAYLVRNIAPDSRWPCRLRSLIQEFPEVPDLDPQMDMGFPDGWQQLPLWQDPPRGITE